MEIKELRNKTVKELKDLIKDWKAESVKEGQNILQSKEKSFKNRRSIKLNIARASTVLKEKELLAADKTEVEGN